MNASATTDAINIMTIHKAKGLEFDCVVIPFANWELNGNAQEHSYWMPGTAFVGVMDAMAPQAGECDPDILPPLLNVPKNVLVDAFENGHLNGKARDFVEEQLTAVILDNLNKTYVAMTRPRTELHMFTDAGKKNDLKPLLQQFFDNNGDVKPIIGRDDAPTGWYEYGEISTRQAIDAKRTVEPVTARQVAMTRYPVTDIPLEVKVRLEHASSSSIDAGLRLHNVMSRIQDVKKSSLTFATPVPLEQPAATTSSTPTSALPSLTRAAGLRLGSIRPTRFTASAPFSPTWMSPLERMTVSRTRDPTASSASPTGSFSSSITRAAGSRGASI